MRFGPYILGQLKRHNFVSNKMREKLAPAFLRQLEGRFVWTSDYDEFTENHILLDAPSYDESMFEYRIKKEDVPLFNFNQLNYDEEHGLGLHITPELKQLTLTKFRNVICDGCGHTFDDCQCCPDCGQHYDYCDCPTCEKCGYKESICDCDEEEE